MQLSGVPDFIEIYSLSPRLSDFLKDKYQCQNLPDLESMRAQFFAESYPLLLVDDQITPSELIQFLAEIPTHMAFKLRVIYCAKKISDEDILALANTSSIFKLIVGDRLSELSQNIEQAVTAFQKLRGTDDLLGKVRVQNKMLSELNENLEQIIQQRTEHLEKSKQEFETKIREVRDLIKFIKSLSTVEGFEDLILILRQEFIKYHKVRPPLLIYSLTENNYRCVYFQGQQIVDQVIRSEKMSMTTRDPAQLREILAETLERPINPIVCVFLNHAEHNGVFVFEHNLGALEQNAFMAILDQRSESLTIAFDRLALKWKAHQISKQWSTTFDFLQDPIVIVDGDNRIIRSNKVFMNTIGAEGLKTPAQSKGRISVGSKIYEMHAYPILLNNQDKSQNTIIHYSDVTQATDLQGRLVQSEKMAAIGMLAGNIAHELNNPLTGIKSLAQILLTEIPSDQAIHQDLKEVQMAAERSELIIKNLLEFSSLHGDAVVAVSVRDIIQKTMPFLKTAMRYHNSLMELAEGDDRVLIEPHLLQQVVFNLVNNACQAMGDEGDLYLTTRLLPDTIQISVRDTGPGIPPEYRKQIFTPFFTTKEEGQGTGLGLSMSRSIIEKFGGRLFLNEESAPGTEFLIHLPKVKK